MVLKTQLKTAMILAAGRGERMRPLTDKLPKPLLQVGGKSLLAYHIDALRASGYERVVVNHAWLGEKITAAIATMETSEMQVLFSDEGESALETGGGIFQALPLLGERPFTVINADIWCDFPLQQLPADPAGDAHLVLVENPAHNPEGDFYLQAGQLVETGNHKLTYSGIGVYRPEFFKGCTAGAFPLAPMLRRAIASGRVSGELYQGNWFDIGTPQRLQSLDQWLSKTR